MEKDIYLPEDYVGPEVTVNGAPVASSRSVSQPLARATRALRDAGYLALIAACGGYGAWQSETPVRLRTAVKASPAPQRSRAELDAILKGSLQSDNRRVSFLLPAELILGKDVSVFYMGPRDMKGRCLNDQLHRDGGGCSFEVPADVPTFATVSVAFDQQHGTGGAALQWESVVVR